MPIERSSLGARIAEARQCSGITQQQLAHKIGCALSSIRNWEKGTSMPLPVYAAKLERLLGISVREVRDEVETDKGTPPT